MCACRVSLLCVAMLAVFAPAARADQRRDWVLEGSRTGNFMLLDYFGTGAQYTLEHRGSIFWGANSYSLNASTLLSFPGGQVQTHASLRVLFLEFSGTLGYRAIWRNLSFEPGDGGEYCKRCDRGSRRDQDPILGSGPDAEDYPYAEASVSALMPLNEWMVFTTSFSARYEGIRPRSYDPFFTNIHDDGVMWISETNLFFKHRDWGGFAPYLQVMSLPRAGRHETEVAGGFNALMRLGLIRRNDLLLLTFLTRPRDRYYGQHGFFSPIRALLIYRLALEL
jgi:hypothetical protein